MMRHLLDTSALLAHFRNEQGGSVIQTLFESGEAVTLISSITIAEFSRRMRELGADDQSITEALEFYISLMEETVSADTSVAWESDRLQRATPGRLPLADALIAACAVSRKAVLVHRDAHMRLIPSDEVRQLDLAIT